MSDSDPEVRIVQLEGLVRIADVTARFLPQSLDVNKPVPWTLQKASGDVPDLEFSGAQGRVVTIELVLDRTATGVSVQPELDRLTRMAQIVATLKRPPRIALIWPANALPEVKGVIEALAIRYAAFSAAGLPVRATAMLRVREARNLKVGKP